VDAVGWGADRSRYAANRRPGPSIVGVLDIRSNQPTREGVLIEDGIVPGALAHAAHELVTTAGLLGQLESWTLKRSSHDSDPLALNNDALRRTQVYLAMGHDDAGGKIRLEKDRRAFVTWPEATRQACNERQEEYLDVAARERTPAA